MCVKPNRPVLVGLGLSEAKALVFRPDCDMWECPECAEKLKRIWTARVAYGTQTLLQSGLEMKFITLTSHEALKTFAATAAVFPDAWAKLYAAMKRKTPAMAYAMIPECHENGRMHVHLITTAQVSKKWMKDNARKRGLGHQADVQPLESVGKAAAYCAKYLGKGLGAVSLPAHFRRIRLSQNFPTNDPDTGRIRDYDWLVCRSPAALWAACEECQKLGYDMVDLETGEIFDFLDMVQRIEVR